MSVLCLMLSLCRFLVLSSDLDVLGYHLVVLDTMFSFDVSDFDHSCVISSGRFWICAGFFGAKLCLIIRTLQHNQNK
jgi:hypothetical protein